MPEIENLQAILDQQGVKDKENEKLRQENEALLAANKKLKEDQKDFEVFRPILESPNIDFYNIKLSGSATMKTLQARGAKLYGKRFDMSAPSGDARTFTRMRLSDLVTACAHWCVTQNSVWNQIDARYFSEMTNA